DVEGQAKADWAKAHQTADQARKAAAYLSFFTAFSMQDTGDRIMAQRD
ncbi:MAG: hypothetical protein JOZ58_07830, partial [Acetobacteraceae bacterium]|nr:hypothetical protein [Acetobacteraceae bacterium]